MKTIIRGNERSWAIQLISKINEIVKENDLMIKRAGGEFTISQNKENTMFPDVVLYGNEEQSTILQGWELKMPDVPIEDEEFIKDAQRKAIALGLNSYIIWNFTYVVLYARKSKEEFDKVKQWNTTSHIRTRADVELYRNDWEHLLECIILELNNYFVTKQFRSINIENFLSKNSITMIIQRNKNIIADALRKAAFKNSVMEAYLSRWWLEIKAEYENDEKDKYSAYAKSIILNWANRIMFAHIIKNRQNSAMVIDRLNESTLPEDANAMFDKITARCDFYNIFSGIEYNDALPQTAWRDLIEFSLFLKKNGVGNLSQEVLQNILENTVSTAKRSINGQYTTPIELAKIILRLTVKDWSEPILDCCCGTGTIPNIAIKLKRSQLSKEKAIGSVWACDKYKYPLQIANISMTNPDSVNLANRIFQHNALSLSVGDEIKIINPENGSLMHVMLPTFGSVVSNLPFIPSSEIPMDDKVEIHKQPWASELDGRSDLYCYIALKLADLVKKGGTVGIITSNSWLGTNAGCKFIEELKRKYHIKQVHISGKNRWFKNADVITTIMVLEKNEDFANNHTAFWLWQKSLQELQNNSYDENILVNSVLLNDKEHSDIAILSDYTQQQIDELLKLNISYNALFHNVHWLLELKEKILPINEVFDIFRGSRRGWDAMFYPHNGQHNIENIYLRKVLKSTKTVTHLIATANENAFCCSETIDKLKKYGHIGALSWIEKFMNQKNGVGKPLPEVLKRKGMKWYELRRNEMAEIFTTMNPGRRLFFAKFDNPSFINQRLIGLNHKVNFPDEELNHALLNSLVTLFYIEAVGFGRGLGALDINKDSVSKCYMLNPNLLTPSSRSKILETFKVLKDRKIMNLSEEFADESRITFEHEVLKGFGLDNYYEMIKDSLVSMYKTRLMVRNT